MGSRVGDVKAGEDAFARRREQLVAVLRGKGIRDEAVLGALAAVPRHRFVPADQRAAAYDDRPLAIGHDATISQPYVVARMLELAALRPDDRVLDVGTGSGYAAAVAARLAGEVVGVERVDALVERARDVLAALGVDAVRVHAADGRGGWPARAPYDAVLVAAAAPAVPPALLDQLADGGRLVAPVGAPGGVQDLLLVRRDGDELHEQRVAPVRFVPLVADGPSA